MNKQGQKEYNLYGPAEKMSGGNLKTTRLCRVSLFALLVNESFVEGQVLLAPSLVPIAFIVSITLCVRWSGMSHPPWPCLYAFLSCLYCFSNLGGRPCLHRMIRLEKKKKESKEPFNISWVLTLQFCPPHLSHNVQSDRSQIHRKGTEGHLLHPTRQTFGTYSSVQFI